ncbi:GNAT family N-acetyltransferase [Macrococcus hajekii]|uniref:GNAT family N-acetyltransferase n=1 Tax=Macrococcus hajekii TaxID=198482 RepID=A0A4R6BJH2_9STAP|nr:GNAT family N-acetyltransferase [Macrococcus hajekii]TDM01770.1 GNAT family N-acetyltransferase [Macrococcus hajekii]GGB07297.1 N-acetyltransferase [Macrococcus hajekii]
MKLVMYNETLQHQLDTFQLIDEQLKFVKSPQVNVEEAAALSSRQPVFGLNSEDEAVIFFVLDKDSEYQSFFEVDSSIYIRSFAAHPNHLRKGYAKQALQALPGFVADYYSSIQYITLIVDQPNPQAKVMYLNAGFELGKEVQGPRYPAYTMKKRIIK